jgi:hypothetical protein
MIDTATTTDNGVWVDASQLRDFSLDVIGTATGLSLQLQGYNGNVTGGAPSNATSGNPIGAAITANGITQFHNTCKWLKVAVTAITGGNVSVNLFGLS